MAPSTAAAAPDTSNTTSAPAPADPFLHPRDLVDRARVERREPEALDLRAALLVEFDDDDLAAEVPCHGRDQHADRSAADHDGLLAGCELRTAHVVHRDRDGLDERGVVEAHARRQSDERLARARSTAPAASRGSRCR